ncbi:MAG: O-antigen ligase family protein, partial [Sulfurospirillum sp.]|nr:O-antigen ligase family protein [Sulfurospirillum sp.]
KNIKIDNKLILNSKISDINSYLVIFLGFCLPISIAITSLVSAIIVLLWLYEGNFKYKYNIIKNNPIAYAFFAFFIIHVIGLLWSEDIQWGLHIVSKERRILFFLILITIVKKEHVKYYIFSFLLAMSISELFSYSIWLELIAPFKNATIYNPTPFITHISYNPLLAFSIYLFGYYLFLNKSSNIKNNLAGIFFLILMSINMFITGGRSGQIGFFIMIALLIMQYYKNSLIKQVIAISIVLPTIFLLSYNTSTVFKDRVNLGMKEIKTFEERPSTSVGQRLAFLFNSLEIIKENPIFGVGTGDFPQEYKKVNEKNTPNVTSTVNPHNMYALVLAQTGIFGLFAMLSIFYMQIKLSFKKNEYSQIRLALPALFLVIMLGESYLLVSYTSLMFVYFSSFLYKDFSD